MHHGIMFPWPAVPAECKPISRKLELHLYTIISTTGWPLSGYASNWIRGTDTIACTKPWLHSFTPYCAYSLIHSHMCTLCVSLYKCLCEYVCVFCVFWEVKLVLFSKRGRYRSREPRGLRGPRVCSSAHKQGAVPGRTLAKSWGGGWWWWWWRGGGSRKGGATTTLILLKPLHLGHTRGPPNFTLFHSMAPLQKNRNTGKQLK